MTSKLELTVAIVTPETLKWLVKASVSGTAAFSCSSDYSIAQCLDGDTQKTKQRRQQLKKRH